MSVAIAENPRAVIGGNSPPLTPYEICLKEIDDLYDEASLWLDGAKVDSPELADGIGNLMGLLRAAVAKADAARIVEKKPHDDKITEIQDRYNALIGDTKKVKGKAIRGIEACKAALQPWLDAERKRIDEEARLAREAAEKKQREAEEALRAADAANLAARAEAEELVTEAKAETTEANKAERKTATVGGSMGVRAIGLRTVWTATMTDMRAAGRHYWTTAPDAMREFLQGLADTDVRAGRRSIPGFSIDEKKVL